MPKKKTIGDPVNKMVKDIHKKFDSIEKLLPMDVPETSLDKAPKVIYMAKHIAEKSISNLEENVTSVKTFTIKNKEPIMVGVFIGGLAALLYKSFKDAMKEIR